MATKITVSAEINAPIEKVWNAWTNPEDIKQWCNASEDWHAPHAENDLKVGGKFSTTMAAKDGSFSFDFAGEYSKVDHHKSIFYFMADGRTVEIEFTVDANKTTIVETFDAESENPVEMQQEGWQAILNNFKKHVESN